MVFNPSRLSIARKRRVLNKTTLAGRIGVDLRTIARWEKCESEPTPENLDALVRVLDFPRTFFFGDDIEEPLAELTSFRSQKALSAALRDAALAAGAIGFRIADWVNERFELPRVRFLIFRLTIPKARLELCVRNGSWARSRFPT